MTKPRRIQSVIKAFWLMIGLITHMAKPNITKPKRLFITSRYSPVVGNHLEADKPIMIKGIPKPRLSDHNAMTTLLEVAGGYAGEAGAERLFLRLPDEWRIQKPAIQLSLIHI